MDRAATNFREGEAIAFDQILYYETVDLAYTVGDRTVPIESLRPRRRDRVLSTRDHYLSEKGRSVEDRASPRRPDHVSKTRRLDDTGVSPEQHP